MSQESQTSLLTNLVTNFLTPGLKSTEKKKQLGKSSSLTYPVALMQYPQDLARYPQTQTQKPI